MCTWEGTGGPNTFGDILNIALVAEASIVARFSGRQSSRGGCTYCVNFHVGEFASLSTILVSSDSGVDDVAGRESGQVANGGYQEAMERGRERGEGRRERWREMGCVEAGRVGERAESGGGGCGGGWRDAVRDERTCVHTRSGPGCRRGEATRGKADTVLCNGRRRGTESRLR